MPETYNGWTNYETWCVNLWLSNEEGTYRQWKADADRFLKECHGDRDRATSALSALLQGEIEDGGPLADGGTMYSDLLTAALGEVNWHEIAKAFLEE